MAITEDTSNQPVAKTWTTTWNAVAQTTAAFSPQAGTYVIACVAGNINAGSNGIATVTDSSGGGTWAQPVKQSIGVSGTWGAVVAVSGKYFAAAPGSITVSVVSNSLSNNGGLLVVRCLLGASSTQPGATAVLNNTVSAVDQVSVAAGTGNALYGAAARSTTAAMTALANTTVISQFGSGIDAEVWKATAATAGTATYGYSTSALSMICAAEILVAPPPGIPEIVLRQRVC